MHRTLFQLYYIKKFSSHSCLQTHLKVLGINYIVQKIKHLTHLCIDSIISFRSFKIPHRLEKDMWGGGCGGEVGWGLRGGGVCVCEGQGPGGNREGLGVHTAKT